MKLESDWRTARLLGAALLLVCAVGCGGTGERGAESAESSGGEVAAQPDGGECAHYARRICEVVGPRSDTCRATLGVVALMSPRACAVGVEDWEVTLERVAELRTACDALADQVCVAMGEGSEACRAIRGDAPSIPPGPCPTLLQEAPKLIGQLKEREALSAPLSEERWAAVTGAGAPEFGKADAEVVLVEFSDFQCPYCARAAETVAKIKEAYGERIRFVFRQYPLPFHNHAHGAAQASLAAHAQGKFWEYHDKLFDNQDSLDPASLESYAKDVGLDMDAFRAASTGADTAKAVASDVALGDTVHVRGTPTLFINGRRVENAIDYDSVAAEIDAALQAAK